MERDGIDLLLVDSRHLLWRAASAFYDLSITRPDGTTRPTGAIYGWLRIALATYIRFGGMVFACWDRREGAVHRQRMYSGYKAKPKNPKPVKFRPRPEPEKSEYDASARPRGPRFNRTSATQVEHEAMLAQMNEQEITLKAILTKLGIRQASSPGWEADDVIATLCRQFSPTQRIGILSGDRDLIQLVSDNVFLIRPLPKSEFEVLTPAKVKTDMGFEPKSILDFKALAGDASDNIPGATGIGPVTATKLIQEHGTWKQALQWADSTPTSKLAQKLCASRQQVALSAQLATLNERAPLEHIPPAKDAKAALLEIASLKFQSLMLDGRKQLLMAMGA